MRVRPPILTLFAPRSLKPRGQGSIPAPRPRVPLRIDHRSRDFPAFTARFSQPSLAGWDQIQLGHTPQRLSGCGGGVTPTSLCTP